MFGQNLEGGRKDVSHEETAEEAESGCSDACGHEGRGVSDEVQEGGAEEKAGRENPESGCRSSRMQFVGKPTAADQTDDGGGLECEGCVPRGLGLVERELVMQEVRQPSVQEPETEKEDGEDGAKHEEGGGSGEEWQGKS